MFELSKKINIIADQIVVDMLKYNLDKIASIINLNNEILIGLGVISIGDSIFTVKYT